MDELLCRKTILLQRPWPSSWIRTNYKWHRLSRCQLSSLAFLQRFLAVAWSPLDNSPQCLLTTCNRRHLLDPHLPFWPVASSPRSYAVCVRLGTQYSAISVVLFNIIGHITLIKSWCEQPLLGWNKAWKYKTISESKTNVEQVNNVLYRKKCTIRRNVAVVQETKETVSARKTSYTHNSKDRSRLR